MDPRIMVGKPTVKGSRITVEMILRKLGGGHDAGGESPGPSALTGDYIRAAQAFAADYLAEEAVVLAEP